MPDSQGIYIPRQLGGCVIRSSKFLSPSRLSNCVHLTKTLAQTPLLRHSESFSRRCRRTSFHRYTSSPSPDFMNALPTTSLGLARSNGGHSGGVRIKSPATSPISSKTGGERGRKRTQDIAGIDSSPGSAEGDGEGIDERKRQPGVKRACNECRQQKVSHEPSHAVSIQSLVELTFGLTATMRRHPRASLLGLWEMSTSQSRL